MSNVSDHFPHANVMAHANVMGTATLHLGQSRFEKECLIVQEITLNHFKTLYNDFEIIETLYLY